MERRIIFVSQVSEGFPDVFFDHPFCISSQNEGLGVVKDLLSEFLCAEVCSVITMDLSDDDAFVGPFRVM